MYSALRDGDRFVVVASDGVWEFMTNQQVADMVSDYWDDPLQACKVIVAQAYDLWLQYEVRTDDITIIILKIDEGNINSPYRIAEAVASPSGAVSGKGRSAKSNVSSKSGKDHGKDAEAPAEIVPILHSKPVRRVAHNEKRKSFIVATNIVSRELTQNEINAMMVPKNEKDYLTISNYMQRNFLFQHLSVSQMNLIISVMQPVTVKAGEWVIRQGDDGDRFYIIDTGKYEVRVSSDTSPRELDKLGGNIVHTYESSATVHPGFGELSLMYGKPRAASVIAVTAGTLWALDRAVFRQLVLRSIDARKNIVQALKKVELLRVLTLQQFQRLADLLNEEYFTAGTYIIREGEVGRSFYLITEGICNCTKTGGQGGEDIFLVQRKEYEYFGERALLTDEPRAANVIAKTDVKLLSISKSNFEEVLGPLADIIDEDRKQREAMANAILEAPKRLEGIDLRAVVITDPFGPIILGSFRSPKPNLCVRTFLFSEIERLNLSDACITFFDAIRLVTLNHKPNAFIPRIHSYTRDTNCIHLLFRNMIVGDLSNVLMTNNKSKTSLSAPPEVHLYVTACVTAALETMHGAGVIYRSVQPESLVVDSAGHVLLMDYRICKIAAGGKTFTICGVPDYLAPEQIAQTGHTSAVDLWALGVLLYEMAVGSHPFAMAQGEIATYTKISSFGSRDFPALTYPEGFNPKVSALINQLIVPDPESRLGAGQGFKRLQRVPYFESIVWNSLATFASPLKAVCDIVMEDIVRAGMDKSVQESFSKPYAGGKWDQLIQL